MALVEGERSPTSTASTSAARELCELFLAVRSLMSSRRPAGTSWKIVLGEEHLRRLLREFVA
jgi:hypothetical protein